MLLGTFGARAVGTAAYLEAQVDTVFAQTYRGVHAMRRGARRA